MKYANTLHYELQGVNPANLERLNGEKFAWRSERMKANRLVRLYHMAGYEKYAERVENCASYMRFGVIGNRRGLLRANFCKLRLCPICIARGAKVRAQLLSRVMDAVQMEHSCQYIFLTLTVKNVPGDKLGEEIGRLTSAWHRLMNQRPIARVIMGWFRALEITRNGDEYHPHLHAIIAVEHGYHKRRNGLYITKAEWARRWQMALGVDYKPVVWVSGVNNNKGGKGVVLEAAKYATKDSDYISNELSDDEAAKIVEDYTKALYHRRLTAFGGWLKEMAQRLDAENLEDVDLLHGDGNEIREDLAEIIEEYGWHFGAGDYVLAKRYVNPLRVKREEEIT